MKLGINTKINRYGYGTISVDKDLSAEYLEELTQTLRNVPAYPRHHPVRTGQLRHPEGFAPY